MSYLQLVNGRYRALIVVLPALRPIIGKEQAKRAAPMPDPTRHRHGSISSLGIARGLAIAAQSAIRAVTQRTD